MCMQKRPCKKKQPVANAVKQTTEEEQPELEPKPEDEGKD